MSKGDKIGTNCEVRSDLRSVSKEIFVKKICECTPKYPDSEVVNRQVGADYDVSIQLPLPAKDGKP